MIRAIPAAPAAIPPNPSTAATIAITRKTSVQYSIGFSCCGEKAFTHAPARMNVNFAPAGVGVSALAPGHITERLDAIVCTKNFLVLKLHDRFHFRWKV